MSRLSFLGVTLLIFVFSEHQTWGTLGRRVDCWRARGERRSSPPRIYLKTFRPPIGAHAALDFRRALSI